MKKPAIWIIGILAMMAVIWAVTPSIVAEDTDTPPAEVQPLTLEEAIAADKNFDEFAEHWEGPHVKELTQVDDLEAAVAASKEHPIFVFKHSTACPISGRAAVRVDKYLAETGEKAPDFVMVKVIESRPVSNAIAEKLGVQHESPQLLLLKDGKAIWNTSHGNITAENIEKALHEHAES